MNAREIERIVLQNLLFDLSLEELEALRRDIKHFLQVKGRRGVAGAKCAQGFVRRRVWEQRFEFYLRADIERCVENSRYSPEQRNLRSYDLRTILWRLIDMYVLIDISSQVKRDLNVAIGDFISRYERRKGRVRMHNASDFLFGVVMKLVSDYDLKKEKLQEIWDWNFYYPVVRGYARLDSKTIRQLILSNFPRDLSQEELEFYVGGVINFLDGRTLKSGKLESLISRIMALLCQRDRIYFSHLPEDRCGICFDEDTDLLTKCGHRFHRSCISPWLDQNPSCPTCRERVVLYDTKEVKRGVPEEMDEATLAALLLEYANG